MVLLLVGATEFKRYVPDVTHSTNGCLHDARHVNIYHSARLKRIASLKDRVPGQ